MPESTLFSRRFLFLLLAQAGFGFANSSFLLLPKFLATQLAAGPDEIGRVVSASALAIVLFLVPAGSMVDRFGRKGFLIGGAVLMVLVCVAHTTVESIGPLLYALRVAHALAFAYAYAAGAALCVDAAPDERVGQAIGLFGLTYVTMGAFAPAAVESLVDASGWRSAFLLAAAAAGVCGLLSIGIREVRPAASEPADAAPLIEILRRPVMLRALLVIALVGIAFGCAFNFYQPFALSLGMTALRDFFIASALASLGCRLVIGPFIDRIGLHRVSLVTLTLYGLSVFAMTELDRLGLFLLGLSVGCAHGLFYPAYTGLVLAGSPPSERGRRLSLMQAGLNVGVAGGGVLLGSLASRFGYEVIFELAAGIVGLAVLMIAIEASDEAGGSVRTTSKLPRGRRSAG